MSNEKILTRLPLANSEVLSAERPRLKKSKWRPDATVVWVEKEKRALIPSSMIKTSKLKTIGPCIDCLTGLGFGCVLISRATGFAPASIRRYLNPAYALKCRALADSWTLRNKAKTKAIGAAWVKANPEKQRQRQRKWREANRHKANIYEKKALRLHPQRRIASNLRRRVRETIKESKSAKTFVLVGCTPSELKARLESLFLPEMSWDNYGVHGWHIDHRKPLSSFDLTQPEQQRQAFHYSNLQPLWASDNISKHNKYDEDIEIKRT